MSDISASVLAKLKNKSRAAGISYMQCLQLFCQEEFLRKLEKSRYAENLILKGGLFIYTLTDFESRATIDIDFLLHRQTNSFEYIQNMIEEIIQIPTSNDYISMEARGFERIAVQRKYNGVSMQIIARIKNVRVPFNVDIGVGDIVVPEPSFRGIKTQLPDFQSPRVLTYSLESTIAEKFDAILQRFELTGRMKDFYDIYYLAQTFDFNGIVLQTAVKETLKNRGTPYTTQSFDRILTLSQDADIQTRWRYFLKKIDAKNLVFDTVMHMIEIFLGPVFHAIVKEKEFTLLWEHDSLAWREGS